MFAGLLNVRADLAIVRRFHIRIRGQSHGLEYVAEESLCHESWILAHFTVHRGALAIRLQNRSLLIRGDYSRETPFTGASSGSPGATHCPRLALRPLLDRHSRRQVRRYSR